MRVKSTDWKSRPLQDRIEAARRYVAAIPGAESEHDGHTQTFKVALVLIWKFGLSVDEAFPLLAEYSQRCTPPWSENELRHKLESATQNPPKNGIENYSAPVPAKKEAAPGRQYGGIRRSLSDDQETELKNCAEKKPFHPDIDSAVAALKRLGVTVGYDPNDSRKVMAFNGYDPAPPHEQNSYVILPADGGLFEGKHGKSKSKLTPGSKTGPIGREIVEYLTSEDAISPDHRRTIVILAGIPDLVSFYSELIRTKNDDKYAPFSGSTGENTNPEKYAPLLKPEVLQGAKVVILADNDETGRKAAKKWALFCLKHGAVVKIIYYPSEIDGKPIKDTRDFILAGKTLDNLRELMNAAPVLTEDDFPQDGPKTPDVPQPGEIEPLSGKIILETKRTKPTAKAFIQKHYFSDSVQTLRFRDGQPYVWTDNRFAPIELKVIRKQLFDFLSDALIQRNFGGNVTYEPFPARDTTSYSALDAVECESLLESNAPIPAWLGDGLPPINSPSTIIFGKTKNLDIETMEVFEPTPNWFNYNSLDFDYDINPDTTQSRCPRWEEFLLQLFGDDQQSIETLMMFIGLLLTPITKFQKALFIVGPKRSGKGTISKIVEKLVGPSNCCSPTTDSLASQFGLQNFIGKTVAIISDARFARNGKLIGSVEKILNIVGEDKISIDRKYLTPICRRLLTRFVFCSNEMPLLPDSSGAVASRFIILKLTNSFYGHEDLDLESKLEKELPGILEMAVFYLKQLLARGHFIQPESARGEVDLLNDLSSPIGKFVRECCIVDPDRWSTLDDLWEAWRSWCQDENTFIGSRNIFFRNLRAAVPEISKVHRGSGDRFWAYNGIMVKDISCF